MKPDLFDIENDNEGLNPLSEKHIYFSGEFLHNDELKKKLEENGAYRVDEIKKADVIVLGDSQPKSDAQALIKRQLWDGVVIPTITEEQLLRYCSKCWEYFKKLLEPKEREKLSITYDHFVNPIYTPIAHFTDDEDAPTLEGKNVFMLDAYDNDNLLDDPIHHFLAEKMGAIVVPHFYPEKTDYCLLRKSTLEKLKEGQKDTFIKMIENGYNRALRLDFRPKFILEIEVIAIMESSRGK